MDELNCASLHRLKEMHNRLSENKAEWLTDEEDLVLVILRITSAQLPLHVLDCFTAPRGSS